MVKTAQPASVAIEDRSPAGIRGPFHFFEALGIEIEYMIVDAETLDVLPIADVLIRSVAGEEASEATPEGPGGPVVWCNELALHVVEFKGAGPVTDLEAFGRDVVRHVELCEERLAGLGARLMPTAMHPWMDPARELRLWPHEHNEVYRAYDRIFSCKGHGWANLQSLHLNLPFAGDDEFGRLHAAARLVLPILPALAASSPVHDGRRCGLADARMEVYRTNSARIPSVAGKVIPEPVYTRSAYDREILRRMYDDIAPHDPEAVLQHPFLNSRGCIARFERGALEIRVLDTQECPDADLAVAGLVESTVRALVEERWMDRGAQMAFEVDPLHQILLETIRSGERARIRDRSYLQAFGFVGSEALAGDLWRHLAACVVVPTSAWHGFLDRMLAAGTLSTRIGRAVGDRPSRAVLTDVYRRLCDSLRANSLFAA